MPVIAASFRVARRLHFCGACDKSIHRHTKYVRAYGYAHRGDKPYALPLHVECAGTETNEKLRVKEPK